MKTYHYICGDCAGREGNRGATWHTAVCDKCGVEKGVAHVRDFGLDEQLVFRNLPPLD